MITTLQEAMERARVAKATQGQKKGNAPTLDVGQILERLKAATALREQAVSSKELSEDVISAAEKITADQQKRRSDIVAIDAAMKKGNLLPETGNEFVQALQAEIAEWSQHLRVLMAEYPSLATVIAQRANFRSRVAELQTKLAGFKIGETRFDEIRSLVTETEHAAVIKRVPKGPIVIGFGPQAVLYGPVSEDPAVLKFVNDFSAFLLKFEEKGREIRDSRRSEVEEFLLAREQVTIYKDQEGTVKSLPEFFAGRGQYVFVPVIGHDVRTGEERFEGEILLERRNSEMVATYATSDRLAHRVFGWYDKAAGVWKRHGVQKVVALRTDEGWDLDAVRNNTLREALQTKLVKDASWQQTRDAAAKLRDISTVEGKAITMAELLRGGEQSTCVVNVRLKAGDKHVWTTMHVVSDGKEAHISAYTPADLMTVVSSLGQFLEPQDLQMLRNDRQWQYIATANQDFEANWLYKQEAEKRGATVLGSENVDGLCSVDNGVDALYGINHAQDMRSRAPLRYIVERKGSEVAVVWAAPGQSWRQMHDTAGEPLTGKQYAVTELPKPIRDTLRNQYRYFKGLGGPAGLDKVPVHLKSPNGATTADEEPQVSNDQGEGG